MCIKDLILTGQDVFDHGGVLLRGRLHQAGPDPPGTNTIKNFFCHSRISVRLLLQQKIIIFYVVYKYGTWHWVTNRLVG